MDKGTPLTCRCPECGSRDVNLSEYFTVSDVYEVRDGVLVDRVAGSFPQATGEVGGECVKCKHIWRLRKNPIQAAFSAANAG
ncbi:TPA: hypothetical protein ACNVX4_005957 [Pseudomonas aeruginosa]|uniref:hypothetical protein n=1 Tax=Pseudomonas aeruginosa TaxID=287 RepID=UPI00287D0072|nr:hypothetical protein [Pseudomonas aeruginosa]EKF7416893.1 hypothetical protein [Pseudomonas aeruginosa]MDS9918404.1 hypothetical protein [Pseudomonas aeruginosa]HCA5866523.1 hypothetical protein [Pseudomonas aeruginosa]HCA7376640.1 hypothetical protein [Pseudomonas aeruginosa]HCA7774874.1 hypothetical protein [Pseudomonas aeruginosa]